MPTTLGLDEEWGGEDLVRDLECIFEVKFSNDEVEKIATVGALYDLLNAKISPNENSTKCASAMVFYRLRQALRRLGHDDAITSITDLRMLERRGAKLNLRRLEEESGLRLPEAVLTPIHVLASLCCIVVAIGGALCIQFSMPSALFGSLAGLAVAFGLSACFVGEPPPDCMSLGSLAKRTTALNYGRLVKIGARHRDSDSWDALLTALSAYDLSKSEITRETCFFRSQLKKRAAA